MHIYLNTQDLQSVLRQIKDQSINITVQNNKGVWLNNYFAIDDIVQFQGNTEIIPVVILRSVTNSKCTILDMRSILSIRLDKYLQCNGELLDKIIVLSAIPGFAESNSPVANNTILLTI